MSDETYEYRFEDRSLALKVMKPGLARLVGVLPTWLSPNAVTLGGHVTAWLSLAVVLLTLGRFDARVFVFIAVANTIYIVADCVDGMLARHTNRASPLGELLDHWLDAYSVPMIPFGVGLAMQQPGWLVLAATLSTSFTCYATFLHGYRFGHVQLGPIGIVEGSLIASTACIVAAIVGPGVIVDPRIAGISLGNFLLVSTVLGALGGFGAMKGLLTRLGDLLPIAILFAVVLAWYGLGRLDVASAGLLLLVAGARQSGQTTAARLVEMPLALWDPIAFGALGAAAGASLVLHLAPQTQTTLALAVAGYVVARDGARFFASVARLRARSSRGPAPYPT